MTKTEFVSYSINRLKLLYLFPYILLWGGVGILLMLYYNNRFLEIACFLVMFLPLILLKKIFQIFTFYLKIQFNPNSFSITTYRINKNEQTNVYDISDILSYQVIFPNRRFQEIVFNMKSGSHLRLSLLCEKNEKENIDTSEIIIGFHEFIKQYNAVEFSEKITLLPSFYASKIGLFSIIFLFSLFIAAIILHIIYDVKTLPITLFLIFLLIIRIILKRKKELDFYNKMK